MVLSQELAERLSRMEEKDDKVLEQISIIRITLAQQQVSLNEHMRRTAANEAQLEHIRTEMRPLALHVAWFGATAKVFGALATIVGLGAAVAKLFGQ